MKLVHIISSLEMGGAQAVLFDLVRAFKREGYDQTVLFLHDGPYRERLSTVGISVQQVTGLLYPYDPIALYRLIKILNEIQPDCMHTILWAANWLGRLAARFLGIPCITSLHNNYDQNGRVRSALDRIVSYQHTQLVAVSSEVKASFQHYFSDLDPTIICNGIDLEALQKVKPISRAAVNLSEEHLVIGSVGRFHPIKRYPLLLEAFKQLHEQCPQARLILIGSGSEEKNLKQYAECLGIAPLIRWVIGESAQSYYRLFDCFVLTSPKEGISIALLEAMALGRCCVITNHVAEHAVIQNNYNGFVASSQNATELPNLLGMIAQDTALRLKIGAHAQQTVHEQFAAKYMITAYQQLIEQMRSTI